MPNTGMVQVDVLGLDFDGTIRPADGTQVNPQLLGRLAEVRRRGVVLILATGRCRSDMKDLMDTSIFDALVLENGAIAYIGDRKMILYPRGWDRIRDDLVRSFGPIGPGEAIISLSRNLEGRVLAKLPAGARVELNKDSLMIMPSTVSKASGIQAVLRELETRHHAKSGRKGDGSSREGSDDDDKVAEASSRTPEEEGTSTRRRDGDRPDGRKTQKKETNRMSLMFVGDAENDISAFGIAQVRVAVKNSSEMLKEKADYITKREDGMGVLEAIARFIP